MARLPTAADFDRLTPQASVTNAGYTPTGGRDMMALGEGLGNVADAFMREHEKQQQEQDDLEFAHVNTEMTLGYANMMSKLQSDPDYKNIPNKYKQQSDKLINTLVSQVSPRNQKKIQARLLQSQAAGYDNALNIQRTKFHDYLGARRVIATTSLQEKAVIAKTKKEFELYLQPIKDMYAADVRVGAIGQEQAFKEITQLQHASAKLRWESTPAADRLEIIRKASGSETALIKDYGADTVKPYTPERIAQIRKLVNEPSEYDALFEEAGNKYGIDPKELKLRAVVESGLNATAQAKATPYGQSGGLMQLEAGTAKSLGVTDRNDPRQSVMGAAKLLAQHKEKAGDNQDMLDKLYYAGSEKNMGKNTEQYAENLRAVRNGDGFAETGTIFDYMDVGDKIRALSAKDTVTQAAIDNEMASNPNFLTDITSGKYDSILSPIEKEKYTQDAVELNNKRNKRALDVRIAQQAGKIKTHYDEIQVALSNDDTAKAFEIINKMSMDLVDSGQPTQIADDLRTSLIKTNPYSEEEKAIIYNDIINEFTILKNETNYRVKKGKAEFDDTQTDLQEVARLQQKAMNAKLSGIKGLESMIEQLAPVLIKAAENERGKDDVGWNWGGEPLEYYDVGTQFITDYLDRFGQQDNKILRAKMMQEFIARSDAMPKEISSNPEMRDEAFKDIAINIAARWGNKVNNMKYIPIADIRKLQKEHSPADIEEFNNIYGAGRAESVLGK